MSELRDDLDSDAVKTIWLGTVFDRIARGRTSLLLYVVVFLLTIAGFLPTLQNGFIDWQDSSKLIDNPNYRGLGWHYLSWMFTTLHSGYYQPLTWFTFAIDFLLWESDPFGYHLTSLLIHGANAALLYGIALKLLSTDINPAGQALALPIAAAFAALVFSLHPLRVEPVAWASARNHLLSAFFLLVALHCFLRSATEPLTKAGYSRWLILALIAHGLSILSGANGLALPILITLLDIYRLGRLEHDGSGWIGLKDRKVLFEKVPFLLVSVTGFIIARYLQPESSAAANPQAISQTDWLAQLFYGPAFYLWKNVAPVRLLPAYDFPEVTWHGSLFLVGVFIITLTTGVIYLKTRWALGAVAWLCYLMTAVVAGTGIGSDSEYILSDRFNYLPSLVLALLVGVAVLNFSRAWAAGRLGIPSFLSGTGGILVSLIVLGVLTWKQAAFWYNAEKLWRYTVAVAPESRQVRHKLSDMLIAQNKKAEAIQLHVQAARDNPDSALTHADLARILTSNGRLDDALQSYRRALDLNPTLLQALFGLGNILVMRGDLDDAVEQYRKALNSTPSASYVHVNLGYALARQGRTGEAIHHYRRALQMDPTNVNAYFNLASTLAIQGQFEEAIQNYREALKIWPSHTRAHYGLANLLVRRGNLKEAIEHYQKAIKFDPDYAEPYHNLGMILADQGQLDRAIAYFRHALGIRPGFAEARLNLARALAAQGKKEEAVREYEEVKHLLQSRNISSTGPVK